MSIEWRPMSPGSCIRTIEQNSLHVMLSSSFDRQMVVTKPRTPPAASVKAALADGGEALGGTAVCGGVSSTVVADARQTRSCAAAEASPFLFGPPPPPLQSTERHSSAGSNSRTTTANGTPSAAPQSRLSSANSSNSGTPRPRSGGSGDDSKGGINRTRQKRSVLAVPPVNAKPKRAGARPAGGLTSELRSEPAMTSRALLHDVGDRDDLCVIVRTSTVAQEDHIELSDWMEGSTSSAASSSGSNSSSSTPTSESEEDESGVEEVVEQEAATRPFMSGDHSMVLSSSTPSTQARVRREDHVSRQTKEGGPTFANRYRRSVLSYSQQNQSFHNNTKESSSSFSVSPGSGHAQGVSMRAHCPSRKTFTRVERQATVTPPSSSEGEHIGRPHRGGLQVDMTAFPGQAPVIR